MYIYRTCSWTHHNLILMIPNIAPWKIWSIPSFITRLYGLKPQIRKVYNQNKMIPARGPQTVCLMQSLFCNHSAIFALQSFAMQSLLFCNLCYAIVAMQSLLCNLCYAIFAMQPLLCNLCFPLFFELRLQKTL